MTRFTKLALAGTAAFTLAAGVSYAQQQAAPQVPPPPAEVQQGLQPGAGPNANADGCGDGMMWGRGKHGRGMQMGMNEDGEMGHGEMGRGHGRDGMMRGGKRGPGAMLDANNDGTISDDEAAFMADRHFNRLDQDQDGSLTETEFTAPPQGKGWRAWFSQAETDAVVKVRKDAFATMDTDKNGSVSKAEFFADAKAKLAAADTDKDGKLSPWEFRAMPRL